MEERVRSRPALGRHHGLRGFVTTARCATDSQEERAGDCRERLTPRHSREVLLPAVKDCSTRAAVTLTAVFTPDENGWTMAQLAEWPAVVTCGRTVEEARVMLLDAAREMIASYREQGREPPIGGGHAEQVTI